MILKYYKSTDGRTWAIPREEYDKRVAEIEGEIVQETTEKGDSE